MTQPPPGYPSYPPQQVTTCLWHPDRATQLSCSRCGRPACPECLTPASVGFHCRACQEEARQVQRTTQARTVAGGSSGGGKPVVTFTLIGINLAVFLVTMVQGGGEGGLFSSSVYRHGSISPMVVASGEWWQFITSGFLHNGVTHIAMNMLSLYFIGPFLERQLGVVRYLTVYLLSLLGGSVAVYLLADVDSGAAGASGAIFGLLGAMLVAFKRLRLDLRQLGVVVALNAVLTFTISNISWQGHVGGFVVGVLLGAAMFYAPQKSRMQVQVGSSVAVFVVLLGLILYRDSTIGDWICNDLSCRQIS